MRNLLQFLDRVYDCLLYTSTQIQANATWSLSLDEDNGLPTLIKGGGTALTSDFLFFDKNWGWTNQESNFKSMGPGKYQLSGNNKTLGFTLNANIGKVSNQKMFWDIELNARAAKKDVIGGGAVSYTHLDVYKRQQLAWSLYLMH